MNTSPSDRGARAPRRGNRVAWALLALTAAWAAGCGLPPTRVEFIETMAKENRDIARSTRAFRSAILPLKDGQAANASQVRSAYKDMESTVKRVKADMDFQLLPPSSNSAKGLLEAYKKYLAGQQDILQSLMLPIVTEVEKPTADSPAGQWAIIKPLLDQVAGKENDTWGPLLQAQNAYASEHNYQALGLDAYVQQIKSGK
jgi:hypothetical protein